MPIKEIQLKWKIIYLCFFSILFILLIFKLNLIATIICVGTVLYILSSLVYLNTNEKQSNKTMIKMNDKKQDKKALMFFAYLSIFATFISLGGEEHPKYLVGLILFIMVFGILMNVNKYSRGDKKKYESTNKSKH